MCVDVHHLNWADTAQIPRVLAEVRDEASREYLKTLPAPLSVLEPTPECMQYTRNFAQETGRVVIFKDVFYDMF